MIKQVRAPDTNPPRSPRARLLVLLVACLLACASARAADWPRFLGPHGDGTSDERGLAGSFPTTGPRELWRRETGDSWAAPAIAKGRLVLFHRKAGAEVVDCLDAATGAPVWSFSHEAPYEDAYGAGSGPRATPIIAGDRVYTLGVTGRLTALDFASGKQVWARDLLADFHPDANDLFFGVGMSPVLEGDLLLIGIGGTPDAGIVALDRATGKTVWTATNDGPSYSTPLVATVNNALRAFFLTRAGAVALDPRDGKVSWTRPFRSRTHASVNAATPVLAAPGQVFFSSSYDVGAMLLDVTGPEPREVWRSDVMSNHFATAMADGGCLYGFDGRYDFEGSNLRAVDIATGKLLWKEESVTKGTLIHADGRYLIWADGTLTLADLTPRGYRPLASAKLLPGPAWTPPALADGRLYVRNEHTLVCVSLRKEP